jgi:RNA polymerase sigma factor (sigma-70 family)
VDLQLTPSEADELARCFETHSKDLFVYACVVTRADRALAGDLVQHAFEEAAYEWRSLRELDQRRLRGWLRTVLRNTAVSEFRRNGMARRMLGVIEQRYRGPEADTERDALHRIKLERCWQEISAMPERQSLIALMFWGAGMTQPEIAEDLGIAPKTVATQVHRARKKLLAVLKERDPIEQDDMERADAALAEEGASA